jgi:hypothetical protein
MSGHWDMQNNQDMQEDQLLKAIAYWQTQLSEALEAAPANFSPQRIMESMEHINQLVPLAIDRAGLRGLADHENK